MKKDKNTFGLKAGLGIMLGLGTIAVPADADENDLLAFARSNALLAGGAQYCRIDEEMVDEFTARVDARIALLAKDDYEKVLARLEFKNMLAGAAVRAPEGGCDSFVPRFEKNVKSAR